MVFVPMEEGSQLGVRTEALGIDLISVSIPGAPKPRQALRDALAGMTLASMNIPKVLGYTRIAGTPVVTGLYTVLLPLVAFALFGSSRHLVVSAEFRDRGDLLQRALAHGRG